MWAPCYIIQLLVNNVSKQSVHQTHFAFIPCSCVLEPKSDFLSSKPEIRSFRMWRKQEVAFTYENGRNDNQHWQQQPLEHEQAAATHGEKPHERFVKDWRQSAFQSLLQSNFRLQLSGLVQGEDNLNHRQKKARRILCAPATLRRQPNHTERLPSNTLQQQYLSSSHRPVLWTR